MIFKEHFVKKHPVSNCFALEVLTAAVWKKLVCEVFSSQTLQLDVFNLFI